MLRPITCKCGHILSWFDDATGYVRDERRTPKDADMKIFGAVFFCEECRTRHRFKGWEIANKLRRQREEENRC